MSCLHVLGFPILNPGTCHFKKSHRRKRAEAVTRSPMPISWYDTLQCQNCDMTCSKKSFLSSQPALCCRVQQCWRFRSFFNGFTCCLLGGLKNSAGHFLDTLPCTHACCYIYVYINKWQRRYLYVHTSTMSLDNGKRPPLNWYHNKFDIYVYICMQIKRVYIHSTGHIVYSCMHNPAWKAPPPSDLIEKVPEGPGLLFSLKVML